MLFLYHVFPIISLDVKIRQIKAKCRAMDTTAIEKACLYFRLTVASQVTIAEIVGEKMKTTFGFPCAWTKDASSISVIEKKLRQPNILFMNRQLQYHAGVGRTSLLFPVLVIPRERSVVTNFSSFSLL